MEGLCWQRARSLSLPTATPDALGYLTRSVDILAGQPGVAGEMLAGCAGVCLGLEGHVDAPRYAPRECDAGRPLSRMISTATAAVPTVCRPSNGVLVQPVCERQRRGLEWGLSSDVPAPGDYDGEASGHRGLSTSSGPWFRLRSIANNTQADALQWGTTETFPCRPTTMAIESTTRG